MLADDDEERTYPAAPANNHLKIEKDGGETEQRGQREEESEGYEAYLANIPESARLSNVLGALKQLIGSFKTRNLIKLDRGSCKIVFERRESRDKLINAPFSLYGTRVQTSLEPFPEEIDPTVYLAGLPLGVEAKHLLGAIKSVVGEFTATNTIVITDGYAKVVFKDPRNWETLLEKGLTVRKVHIRLSKQPWRKHGVINDVRMKRGYSMFTPQADPFMKRRRLGVGSNEQQDYNSSPKRYYESRHTHSASHQQSSTSWTDTGELELDNRRLKLRVNYLEEQLAIYEEWFAKRRGTSPRGSRMW